ncbi:DNA-directed DNA polymerase delta [Mitosporidium daphniae]
MDSPLEEVASGFPGIGLTVVDVRLVKKKSIYGYTDVEPCSFLRISVTSPTAINTAKKILESGFVYSSGEKVAYQTFESNIPFLLRFMIDCKEHLTSLCQIEIDTTFDKIISFTPDGIHATVPPLRILSFDIECAGRKGIFPEPHIDAVIQIGNVFSVHGEGMPRVSVIFTLNTCSQIAGAEVLSFANEADMLAAWSQFVRTLDPDIITGYNINNFDLNYLLDRAHTLRETSFPFLGRIPALRTKSRDSIFSSKAYGTRESKEISIDGRVILDMIQVIQRDYKLRSYSLNSVCAHFLGEQKEDVHHSIITDLQNGNSETRRRLAVYCLKDALLPQRLIDRLMSLVNYIEMARVTGIPFNFILQRGQQIRVISQLYRKASEEGYVVPALRTEGSDEQYEGATVIEPIKGYYDIPIATLDFASLYPSIMMAHNLCYTTLLDASSITKLNLSPSDYIRTPSGDYFVASHVRKGLLPQILEDLLEARKRAKNDLKSENDRFRKAVLDGRQLALKISANSVYGFTGATVGKLPCIQISQSTTSFGRQMIDLTKEMVEKAYTIENGYDANAKVIYGDTDSVMINFGAPDLAKTMELGKLGSLLFLQGRHAANFVSSSFKYPIRLEFEKAYFPYLLINKKRYAGLYWSNPHSYDKIDAKGIETVRRDNCPLVQTLIQTCLNKILIDRDVEGAKQYAKQVISDLLQNKIDISLLVITKALTKSGESYAGKQAHVELAEKMRKRDAGSAPSLGDRVAYVITKSTKGAAAYEKSEDPLYVLEHNIPIDTKYYLENQLSKPLLRIFEPVIKHADELLAGDHTRTIHVAVPTLGALRKFAVKTESCLGCKAPLAKEEKLVCKFCRPELPKFYLKHVDMLKQTEIKFNRLWTQCQRCQGSLHQDVLCTSKDCPIFYMRKKAQKEVKEVSDLMEKFEFDW